MRQNPTLIGLCSLALVVSCEASLTDNPQVADGGKIRGPASCDNDSHCDDGICISGACTVGARAYDPCQNKSCGDECQLCPPEDDDCVEAEEIKRCGEDGLCYGVPVSCEPAECSALAPEECADNGCSQVSARRFPSGESEAVGCISADQACGEAITCGVDASEACWEFNNTCLPESFEAISCDDERCCSESDCPSSCEKPDECVPDAGTSMESRCDGFSFEQVEWGADGGRVLYRRVSRASADGSFSITLHSDGEAPDVSCEPLLPNCGGPDLDLDDIALAIAHTDVEQALASNEDPKIYGLDPRPYDGVLLRVSIDGRVLHIGSPCESGESFCNPGLTPGLVALGETLEAIANQQVADPACDDLRNP